jgi:hypothetical protein
MGTTAGNTTTLGNSTGNTTINGATNAITGTTNNITGTTNINTTGTANTSIGVTGANSSSTTINVGTAGTSLTLNGLGASTTNTSFLTLNGSNVVQTDALSNFIQGTNGVLVLYPSGVATAQFANSNTLVPFTSDRYINTASFILHITNSTPADFATFNGANSAIGLNAGNTNGVTTIGNVANATTNLLDGLTTANPPSPANAGTNTLSVSASPDAAATWAFKASSALTDANASQSIFGTATSSNTVGNAATAGRFDANGNGTTNTALALNAGNTSPLSTGGTVLGLTGVGNVGAAISASGSTAASNIGELIRASGNGSIGIDILGAVTGTNPVTGINIDASSSTMTGMLVNGVEHVGVDVNFTSGQTGSVWGYDANMAGISTGTYSGFHVQNLSANNTTGLLIENMSAGTGINVSNITGGTGISVSTSTTGAAVGIVSDAHNGGGATALKLYGDGTTNTVALQVGNAGTGLGGNVVSDGNANSGQSGSAQNVFAGTYTLTTGAGSDESKNVIKIYNTLVETNSTIMITVDATPTVPVGEVFVENDAADGTGFNTTPPHFDVYTTAATFGVNMGGGNYQPGTYKIHYIIINH